MESKANSLLNVPITEAERRTSRQSQSRGESSRSFAQYQHDRQAAAGVSRFSSLRLPEERYDDPDHQYEPSGSTIRPGTLPEIEEESHFSDHDEEEPINQPPVRSTTFPRTSAAAYQPVRNAPEPCPVHGERQLPKSSSPMPHFWQPIWLRRITLILMTLLLVVLMVGLIALSVSCVDKNGFRVNSANEYASHYATLIAIIVYFLWRSLDFHTKSLMPWKELTTGPTSPFDSILIDYISKFQITALVQAFKRLHIPVVITTTAFFFAKGITIAATGIFIVQRAEFNGNFPTTFLSTFDSAALDPAILSAGTFPNSSVYTYTQSVVNGLGAQLGISPEFAYVLPTLHSDSIEVPENATFTATTDTFVPVILCRAANVTLEGEATIETVEFPYNSTETPYGSPANLTLNIDEGDICNRYPQLSFNALDPLRYIVPEQQIQSRSELVRCEDNPEVAPILLLSMLETTYSQELLTNVTRPEGEDLPIALNTQRSISRMVNVLCQADYTISKTNVTNNTALVGVAAITLTPIKDAENRTLDGLTPTNMTTIYNAMLGSNSGLFIDLPNPDFLRTPAFDLLAFAAGEGNYDDLFDSQVLADAAQQVYLGAMPDFAARTLVRTTTAGENGPVASVSWSEERLYPNWTPIIIVLTGLGLMALLTGSLIMFIPQNLVPRDPNSIAAAATTLSRSFELNRLLRKLQSPQNKGIAAALNGYEVGTAIAIDESSGSQSFKIHVTEGRPQWDVQDIAPNSKYWNPVWASLPIMVCTFCLPLVIIVILEILQRKSDRNPGLFDVPDDRGTSILSVFFPAFVTLIIAAIYDSLYFYIALFAPWAKLLKTNVPAHQSILTNVLGHILPSAVFKSFKARYWGAMLAALATLFAALLTVLASGLYNVEHFDTQGPSRPVSRLDQWNLDAASTYTVDNDNGAAAMLNLIQHNSSFPKFAYDEYALPRMSFGDLEGDIPEDSRVVGSMEVTAPAARGNLTCHEPSSYSIETDDSVVRVSASYDVPESCLNGIDSLDAATMNFSTEFRPAEGAAQFGGKQFDLRFGTNSSEYGHLGEDNSSLVADNPPVGCPSLAFIWGNFQLGSDNKTAVNVAVCYQQIHFVDVNVTFQQNSTEIDIRRKPRARESEVDIQTVPNGTVDTFDFRIQNNLARQLGTFEGGNSNMDSFFQSMINGSIQMNIDMFVNNRSMALMGISHTYRLYMAQVINSMFRSSENNARLHPRQSSSITPARTLISRTRLVQDKTSKDTMQGLCALSAILIALGYILTKTRNVLPCNPCSIAGTMSLLAGSDLCYAPDSGICECCGKLRRSFKNAEGRVVETIHAGDNEDAEDDRIRVIRDGAEWMDEKTFAGLFEGRTYSLGWWDTSHKKGLTKRYGVDYGDSSTGGGNGDDGNWYLGRRKNSETFEIFSEQVDRAQRGRARALSDVNERGQYQRADPSPGVEEHELRNMARGSGREGRYGD